MLGNGKIRRGSYKALAFEGKKELLLFYSDEKCILCGKKADYQFKTYALYKGCLDDMVAEKLEKKSS